MECSNRCRSQNHFIHTSPPCRRPTTVSFPPAWPKLLLWTIINVQQDNTLSFYLLPLDCTFRRDIFGLMEQTCDHKWKTVQKTTNCESVLLRLKTCSGASCLSYDLAWLFPASCYHALKLLKTIDSVQSSPLLQIGSGFSCHCIASFIQG